MTTSKRLASPEMSPAEPVGARAGTVLAKAALRAAERLDLSQRDFARIVGLSEASASRMARDPSRLPLDPASKEGELALLFLRVFRSLDSLVGGDGNAARAWLHAENVHLNGVPAERIRTVEGLVHVGEYLDALRGAF